MVLRSGIIIPFQFRDAKKLLMIGVPEENRNLSIWDLKNVVRAAFGIYNFEFRNKKIGFNIPDELLLQYLAQRHDLTNFVIEIGQVYDPCKENTYTQIPNCNSCRCATQKCLDLHVTTNITNQPGQSTASSQNAEEPPLKLRITNPPTIAACTPEVSQIQIEPQIEYKPATNSEADPDEPIQTEQKFYAEEERAQEREMQFVERMQQEFFLQQQQQQHQQQHMESLLQETTAPGLRQRKERMSKKQKDVYVNFLEQNPFINEHRRNDPLLDRHWGKLADILNSVPQGAVKHVAEWKQTFDNWRYRVFLYARYNSKLTDDGGSSPKSFKPLTQTDKRAYNIWIHNSDTAPPDLDKMRNVFANLDETTQQE